MTMTRRAHAILAIVPKASSALSLCGSIFIVCDVAHLKKKKKHTIYHRLYLGIVVSDIISSAAMFFSTWPMPSNNMGVSAYGAAGTQGTCTAQGLLTQLSICTAIYSGSLAVYYLLVVGFGWSDLKLKNSKVELKMNCVTTVFGFTTAIVSAVAGLFNPIEWECWFHAVPRGCKESWYHGKDSNCVRGDNATLFQWLFYFGPLWLIIIVVLACMRRIKFAVQMQEEVSSKWSCRRGGESSNLRGSTGSSGFAAWQAQKQPPRTVADQHNPATLSERVAVQARVFSVAFCLAWIIPTVFRTVEQSFHPTFSVSLLSAAFVPLHGLWNVLVYLRPRYVEVQTRRKANTASKDIRQTENRENRLGSNGAVGTLELATQASVDINNEPTDQFRLDKISESLGSDDLELKPDRQESYTASRRRDMASSFQSSMSSLHISNKDLDGNSGTHVSGNKERVGNALGRISEALESELEVESDEHGSVIVLSPRRDRVSSEHLSTNSLNITDGLDGSFGAQNSGGVNHQSMNIVDFLKSAGDVMRSPKRLRNAASISNLFQSARLLFDDIQQVLVEGDDRIGAITSFERKTPDFVEFEMQVPFYEEDDDFVEFEKLELHIGENDEENDDDLGFEELSSDVTLDGEQNIGLTLDKVNIEQE